MNEYKNFFKKIEKNSSHSSGQKVKKVRMQNPLDKQLKEQRHIKNQQSIESKYKNDEQILKKGIRLSDLESQLAKSNLRLKTRKTSQKKKSRFPIELVSILSIGFGFCLWSLIEPDSLNRMLNSFEFSAFGTASATSSSQSPADKITDKANDKALGKNGAPQAAKSSEHQAASNSKSSDKEISSATSDHKKEDSSESGNLVKPISAQQVREWTDEELSFFNDLNKRKEVLEKKEKELSQLEEELQKRQSEIEGKIKELEKTRAQIAGVLQDRVKTDEERVDKLVQFYSNMKPTNAAKIIATLEEGLAITILNKMKKQEAAAILNFIEPQRAKEISERFAGYVKAP